MGRCWEGAPRALLPKAVMPPSLSWLRQLTSKSTPSGMDEWREWCFCLSLSLSKCLCKSLSCSFSLWCSQPLFEATLSTDVMAVLTTEDEEWGEGKGWRKLWTNVGLVSWTTSCSTSMSSLSSHSRSLMLLPSIPGSAGWGGSKSQGGTRRRRFCRETQMAWALPSSSTPLLSFLSSDWSSLSWTRYGKDTAGCGSTWVTIPSLYHCCAPSLPSSPPPKGMQTRVPIATGATPGGDASRIRSTESVATRNGYLHMVFSPLSCTSTIPCSSLTLRTTPVRNTPDISRPRSWGHPSPNLGPCRARTLWFWDLWRGPRLDQMTRSPVRMSKC